MTDPTTETSLRFAIDTEVCSGHGRCYTLAPQWFDTDDIGNGRVLDVLLPARDRVTAEGIVSACPEGAITLVAADAS